MQIYFVKKEENSGVVCPNWLKHYFSFMLKTRKRIFSNMTKYHIQSSEKQNEAKSIYVSTVLLLLLLLQNVPQNKLFSE